MVGMQLCRLEIASILNVRTPMSRFIYTGADITHLSSKLFNVFSNLHQVCPCMLQVAFNLRHKLLHDVSFHRLIDDWDDQLQFPTDLIKEIYVT